MTWVVTIVAGAIIGWIASMVMKTDAQQGALGNVIIGIVGSLLGKWIFVDLLGFGGAAAAGSFSLVGILWGVLGAIVLIVILKMLKVFK